MIRDWSFFFSCLCRTSRSKHFFFRSVSLAFEQSGLTLTRLPIVFWNYTHNIYSCADWLCSVLLRKYTSVRQVYILRHTISARDISAFPVIDRSTKVRRDHTHVRCKGKFSLGIFCHVYFTLISGEIREDFRKLVKQTNGFQDFCNCGYILRGEFCL